MSAPMMPKKPYQQTGRILFDALLFTAHSYGCENISHASNVISCTRNGQQYRIMTTGQTNCIDILIAIGLMRPQPPRPAKAQLTDPTRHKRKKRTKPAVKELAHAA